MEKVGMVCDLRTFFLKLVDFVGCFGAKFCNAVACGAKKRASFNFKTLQIGGKCHIYHFCLFRCCVL